MHLDQVSARFSKLAERGLQVTIPNGANPEHLRRVQERLGLVLPAQIARFWTAFDGIRVEDPQLHLFSLSGFFVDQGVLHFGRCNGAVPLAFDTRSPNISGQWSIVNAESGYEITLTMASFWSSHMWAWIVKRRPIWCSAHNFGAAG